MREWEIGAVENIHGALPYIRFAPLLALVGVGVNRIGKILTNKCDLNHINHERNWLALLVLMESLRSFTNER